MPKQVNAISSTCTTWAKTTWVKIGRGVNLWCIFLKKGENKTQKNLEKGIFYFSLQRNVIFRERNNSSWRVSALCLSSWQQLCLSLCRKPDEPCCYCPTVRVEEINRSPYNYTLLSYVLHQRCSQHTTPAIVLNSFANISQSWCSGITPELGDCVLQPHKGQSVKRNTFSNLVGSDDLKGSIAVTGFQERRKILRPIIPEKGLCKNGIEKNQTSISKKCHDPSITFKCIFTLVVT